MADKIIKFYPKHIKEIKSALDVLRNIPDEDVRTILAVLSEQFIDEIRNGLEGEVEYNEAPFFAEVDKLYQDAIPKGCYFCDPEIDPNDAPFDFPENAKLCPSCQLKVANILKAFGIHPECLFPGIGERKKQEVIYEILRVTKKPEGEAVH